jgi:hypothetical protein
MSLNILAQQAVDRQVALRVHAAPVAPGAPPATTVPTREDALSGIAKFIPTEVVTLYLFALSVVDASTAQPPNAVWDLYGTLLAITPVCFWLIFAGKFRSTNATRAWPRRADVPWFPLVAATIGFAVWAPAVPKSGVLDPNQSLWIGFAALAVSTVLSLLERVFEPAS